VSMLTMIRDRSHNITCRAKLRIDHLQDLREIIANFVLLGPWTELPALKSWQSKYLKAVFFDELSERFSCFALHDIIEERAKKTLKSES
jgi:hypothetical protein